MPLPDCQPFVKNGGDVTWACAPPIGNGIVGQKCSHGADCRSGFCGSNGTCFRACAFVTDCPNSGGPYACTPVQITVEGVPVTANSCIPG
jgi:hypothetical protein